MTDSNNRSTTRYTPDHVSPPGDTLQELLDERGISQAELATRMGRPRKTISEIVNGKAAITHETALQLELVTGVPADFWNARERDYRAYLAAIDERARLKREAAWCARFPMRDLIALGWLRAHDDKAARAHELLSFLGVVSSEQWDALYSEHAVAFRRPQAFAPDPYALGAWLRKGSLDAQAITTQPFDHDRFLTALTHARRLTRSTPSTFVPTLRALGAAAGVAVVLVPELPKSRASGATRWLTADKAVIQLSLRYRTDDHFWFTFFHEAAHVLLHRKKSIFLEVGEHVLDDDEADANRWAATFLIPDDDYALLCASRPLTKRVIVEFAERIGVSAGIVVGRLQHERKIAHSHLNGLKGRLEWTPLTASSDTIVR